MDCRYWSPDFELGIEEIDRQHKTLAVAIDRFETAVADRDRWIIVHAALVELASWARFHFAVEESLMRVFAFPDLPRHAADHEAFLRRIRSFEEDALRDDVAAEVAGFLKSWLKSHICSSDRAYARYIRGRTALA